MGVAESRELSLCWTQPLLEAELAPGVGAGRSCRFGQFLGCSRVVLQPHPYPLPGTTSILAPQPPWLKFSGSLVQSQRCWERCSYSGRSLESCPLGILPVDALVYMGPTWVKISCPVLLTPQHKGPEAHFSLAVSMTHSPGIWGCPPRALAPPRGS